MTKVMRVLSVEILFTIAMVVIMMALSFIYDLPIIYPSGESAAFVSVHYVYPLIGVGVWGLFALMGQGRSAVHSLLVAFPCYALVLFVHFNIKLWVPYINPVLYDGLYWQIDQAFRPVTEACMALRRSIDYIIPVDSNFYMVGFIVLFYVSFCYHAIYTRDVFRQVFVAALLLQGLGTLSYMVMPALGPFQFEPGLGVASSSAQQGMLQFYRQYVAMGPDWLAQHGSEGFTAGLAAMPSMHAGGAFLFFFLALKHARILVPLYSLLFGFILIAAVATRWHYLVDLPVGVALAWLSVFLAERLVTREEEGGVWETCEPALVTS